MSPHNEKNIDPSQRYQADDTINIRELVEQFGRYWWWYVAGLLLAFVFGFLYLKFKSPVYEAKAMVYFKGGWELPADASTFLDIGIYRNKRIRISNEKVILRSRFLWKEVVEDLGLNIRYFIPGNWKKPTRESYKEVPFHVNAEDPSILADSTISFSVQILSDSLYEIQMFSSEAIIQGQFGKDIDLGFGNIQLTPNLPFFESHKEDKYEIHISPIDNVIKSYSGKLNIDRADTWSRVVHFTINDQLPLRAREILDAVVLTYNEMSVRDKIQIAQKTIEFIDDRLKIISPKLSQAEANEEEYKSLTGITDIESESERFFENRVSGEEKTLELKLQSALADFLLEYLEEKNNDLLPANLGYQNPSISSSIDQYNELILKRNRIFGYSNENNPVIENLDEQIASIRQELIESLKTSRILIGIQLEDFRIEVDRANEKISTISGYEREYQAKERERRYFENLHRSFVTKREAAALSMAMATPNTWVVDKAYSQGVPISPKPTIVYLISLMLGVGIPVVIIYLQNLLDTKVKGIRDIEKLQIPILGDVPISNIKKPSILKPADRSDMAEAFRLLQTNLDFMMINACENGRTILVTSTISKEGKSFIAINIAATLAYSGKKVAMVGMDLRAPKLMRYLGGKKGKGVTHFITDETLTIDDILNDTANIDNLDIYTSGIIPPNPADLLKHPRVGQFFRELQDKYDYIIVDTAPVSMVTDTLLLNKYADLCIYVVRANVLDKRMLVVPDSLYKEKRFDNMAILINGVDYKKGYGFGYGYGYGYGLETKKPWWKRLFFLS